MSVAVSLTGTQMFDAAKEPRASGGEGSPTYAGERPLDRTLFILLSLAIVTISSLLLGLYLELAVATTLLMQL